MFQKHAIIRWRLQATPPPQAPTNSPAKKSVEQSGLRMNRGAVPEDFVLEADDHRGAVDQSKMTRTHTGGDNVRNQLPDRMCQAEVTTPG